LEDDRGIARPLEKLFRSVEVNVRVVNQLPGDASYVIDLRGLGQFADSDITQLLAINAEVFKVAHACGQRLFEGNGCLILPFDNGLAQANGNNRAWLGGISALAKTAQLEWATADVQSINIDSAGKSPEVVAAELFRTITSGGLVTEVEVDEDGKSYQLISTVADIEDRSRSLNDGDTIVVSGGAKGVTAACLVALAERKKLNIAILGRTALEEEPAYLSAFKTDAELKSAVFQQAAKEGRKLSANELNKSVSKILSNREVSENIRSLTKNGSVVKYYSVDISNKKEVVSTIDSIRSAFGSIQGIVHAAGVLADKYIHEKTMEQFNSVFNTKVDGFVNMLEATANDRLTHICCFSSVAARMGNVGQVDYAMANEVLNKVCQAEQKKRKETCVVKSLNWGPWDGGMVSPQLKTHFESMGVDLIPLQTGAEIFADEMEDRSTENVEIVVGGAFSGWGKKEGSELPKVHTMWVHRSNNSFLDSHRIEGKVIVPMMMANEWCLRLATSVCPNLNIAEVCNLKVYKGIHLQYFDGGGDLLSFVYKVEQNRDGFTVVDIKIEDGRKQQMYSVTVKLSADVSHADAHAIDLKGMQSWNWKRKDIYNGHLFHGPDFQVIEKLEGISDNGCHGLLKIDPVLMSDGAWITDMFLFDGGIQLALLAMDKWTGNKSSLPLGYDSLRLFEQSVPVEKVRCELIVTKKGDMNSEWDIHFRGANQQLLAEIKGLKLFMYKVNQN
jgi:NAD(P)-dependent dehydrogenase (short-subunit alcohol dehydrogenase family)